MSSQNPLGGRGEGCLHDNQLPTQCIVPVASIDQGIDDCSPSSASTWTTARRKGLASSWLASAFIFDTLGWGLVSAVEICGVCWYRRVLLGVGERPRGLSTKLQNPTCLDQTRILPPLFSSYLLHLTWTPSPWLSRWQAGSRRPMLTLWIIVDEEVPSCRVVVYMKKFNAKNEFNSQ